LGVCLCVCLCVCLFVCVFVCLFPCYRKPLQIIARPRQCQTKTAARGMAKPLQTQGRQEGHNTTIAQLQQIIAKHYQNHTKTVARRMAKPFQT
jgi:hypothetical protein